MTSSKEWQKNAKRRALLALGHRSPSQPPTIVNKHAKDSTTRAKYPDGAVWSFGENGKLFEETDPFVEPPIFVDHGLNLKVGKETFLNSNLFVLDTCLVAIGERVLFGPNVCTYGATHPMDSAIWQGIKGPEDGKEVHIEDDVWVCGNVIILACVRVERGSTVGAASVVTRDVPPFHFVAGNPARVIRRIETSMDPEYRAKETEGQ
ncbi:sugar O-acetyltransferase [Aspergillus clavatus NRRL 1]|uniref:Uncharacterized protein n=1 Tax=Aspergillus clavatus (strain ATCC 1007 / CBS 513.65 / DSM 816 / NCTC 3887 / NRRL 1 / QM 1276 / 107) TaxID=344612 RepID=A1CTX7_ASPCL|nr:uncharacterized protein ACLA_084590 [Aspergillus clavatus NRRL 1]EAW06764.1 conserved hypothetical protein [Aspergillus clavatus NRRL 1]